MYQGFEVLTLLLVAMAWALSFAHAAEMPGKMRLDRDAYLAVQPIYYPGFTIAASSEPLCLLALAGLLAFTPSGSAAFWLIAIALAAAAATHAVYWLVTHPTNRFWLSESRVRGASKAFFAAGGATPETDWTKLRDRWEWSHVFRAILMTIALVALAVAVTL